MKFETEVLKLATFSTQYSDNIQNDLFGVQLGVYAKYAKRYQELGILFFSFFE